MTPPLSLADVAPESVLLAGAGSAILLQLANPAVGHGVARHSNFAAEPLSRLHGTLGYFYAQSNGTTAQRRNVQARVQRAHLPVKFDGSPAVPAYNASNPAQQLWVAATLYKSAAQIYDAVFPALSPSDAQSVYAGFGVLGTALGMPAELWPQSCADFEVYWEQQLARLSVDDTVREVARELLAAKHVPLWGRVLMPPVRFLTVGLLPPAVREMYGFKWSARQDRTMRALCKAAAVLVRITPKVIRHAPMRHYLKRIPGGAD